MKSHEIRMQIEQNAAEIRDLHRRIHETFKDRDRSPRHREEWCGACREFRRRYNELAFPGGYDGARDRILAGDAFTVEAALCFLEVRPYFFRSGYMFEALVPKLKRAQMSRDQQVRCSAFLTRLEDWKRRRRGNA